MKKIADMMSKTGKWLLVFGFIFSQLSFPLEVLADELIENNNQEQSIVIEDTDDLIVPVDATDINTDEAVIKVNGVETIDYTIEDTTDVSIVLEYQGQEEKVEFDFSKKLYGIYQYTFESVEETVIIRYPGNNADLLKAYEVGTDITKKIVCDMTECIINGFGNESLKVSDINGYYNLESFSNDYDATVSIKDLDDNVADTSVAVVNGYKLEIVDNQTDTNLVNTTPISSYTLNRIGDVFVPSDGLIDAKDQKQIVDDILLETDVTDMNDLNEDGVLNILDATHSTFIENIATGEESDILTNTLIVDKTEVLVGEKIKVELLVNGFDKLSLWGIEGLLEYDNNILKLVGADVYTSNEELETLGYFNLDNNKFAYVLGEAFNNSEIAIVTFEFEALAAGNSEITISNILESYGEAFEVTNDVVTENVTVLEEGIGGDTEEDTPVEGETEDTKEEIIEESKPVVMPIVLSSDYYIKNLSITGYEIDFNMYTYEYSIKVSHDVNSLDFKVLLNDNNSIYYVEGNENFKTGENLVYLIVKAQNGSTKTYTIRVNKEEKQDKEVATEIDEDETDEDSEKSTSKTIIIILIILVIIGLIYVIFKDDEEDKKEVVIKEVKTEKSNSSKEREENKKTSNVKKSPKKGNKK